MVGAIALPLILTCWIPTVAQSPPASGSSCGNITQPLTPEEQKYARAAWQYFVKNYQANTGFTNSTGGYPSGTMWDMGNYLMALNAARWLNLIPQSEFDQRLNKFLDSLGKLRLFEDSLPNKVYHAGNGQLVDYSNKPVERGIGWSALDIGRMLAAFHVLRICHPQYNDWLKSVVKRWALQRSVKDGKLYGAAVLKDGRTLLVQEGRMGYEEYAARGYELWGFSVPVAVSFEPFKIVEIYGVPIPVDTRDYQSTNANNYVVSESYILDGIEFGFLGQQMAGYAANVLEVQKRRYEATGQLTAVTEDNIDGPPYFLYNTVYSNGVSWATINEKNEPYPKLRSISTKAAFGWRYLYPNSDYAKKLFDVTKGLLAPDGSGFYAGLYEETKQPNKSLTGNTNGLILEILHYKALGNRPLISSKGVNISTGKPEKTEVDKNYPPPANAPKVTAPTPVATNNNQPPSSQPPANNNQPPSSQPPANNNQPPSSKPPTPTQTATKLPNTIPDVGILKKSACYGLNRSLSIPEKRYADVAWHYFESNYQPQTGLVTDRADLKGVTLWGMGDYLAALQAAVSLDLISLNKFDQLLRQVLGALKNLPLFAGELPHRGYDARSLEPVDYGTNPLPEGNGWSGLDLGRLLLALHNLKACYPQYADPVDRILLDWSYLRVVRNGRLNNAVVAKDDRGRTVTRVYPVDYLGYEEYAARGFQLWGFEVEKSAVGGKYETVTVEGASIPIRRQRQNQNPQPPKEFVISNPFLRYGLELGFDPQMRSLVYPMLQAQANRYRREGILTAADTVSVGRKPYIVNSTIFGQGKPWANLGDDGTAIAEDRIVSTAAAFAYYALFPDDNYARELWQSTLDIYSQRLGYYEGFYETTGGSAAGFTSSTNSIILQSILFRLTKQRPLLAAEIDLKSPWWRAVADGQLGNGLPSNPTPTVRLVSDKSGSYWVSGTEPTDSEPATSSNNLPSSPTPPSPVPSPSATALPTPSPSPVASATPVATVTPTPEVASNITKSLAEPDKIAARQAWEYFASNWQAKTGLVNSGEGYPWTTWWDQGSAILGMHAARQLALLEPQQFKQKLERLLTTLETLPLPPTKLPNKAYSTATAEMRRLNNTPDPQGTSGWSALDTARLLLSLHVIRSNYPEYRDRVNRIVGKWQLTKLERQGWLQGGVPAGKGKIELVQEGRLGYEQYAAESLKLWGINAKKAIASPPITTATVEGISLQVDRRNLKNSGASNYLTSDPYLLWGLELGWTEAGRSQALKLLDVQEKRFKRTNVLTAVNEDALDRTPYFLYYNVYANGSNWHAIGGEGKAYPNLRFLSTKAAFAWAALMPDNSYAQTLRQAVQNFFQSKRGYLAGRYENSSLGLNQSFNVNTNAVILESLLYKAKGNSPLIDRKS
jgi:hypothetical protein